MVDPTTEQPRGPSRVTHGSVHVLAYLHRVDGTCRQVADQTGLAESSAYRWLTELTEAGIIDAEPVRVDGRAVIQYSLEDDELGAATQVVVDRLSEGPFED